MTALAVAHPHATYPRPVLLRSVPPAPVEAGEEEPPVTVTISIGGGASGRERVLAALRELVDAAGPSAAVELDPAAAAPRADGEIRLDPRARTAFRDGRLLELSRLEYDLLLFLARHPRQVFSRAQLLTHVWGHRHTTNRTVDVHVSRLRTKLDDPELITTVYGLGYRLADEAPITVADR
ncbi:winged helix-turn-helix domain-containing protein [Actinoplanes sp. NPDC023714]|uniref:winged helix-turn-helix domain-containing protein n=1 Tax=Actinoplanes sp. NPDC023714 TaxID=3154322 RepID=UPI0033EB5123